MEWKVFVYFSFPLYYSNATRNFKTFCLHRPLSPPMSYKRVAHYKIKYKRKKNKCTLSCHKNLKDMEGHEFFFPENLKL